MVFCEAAAPWSSSNEPPPPPPHAPPLESPILFMNGRLGLEGSSGGSLTADHMIPALKSQVRNVDRTMPPSSSSSSPTSGEEENFDASHHSESPSEALVCAAMPRGETGGAAVELGRR